MFIYVKEDSMGAVEACPQSWEYQRKIKAHLREFLPKESCTAVVYFQNGEEGYEALGLSKTQIRELKRGWCIRIRIDDYEFLNMVGWDAHCMVESGELYQRSKRARKPAMRGRNSDSQPANEGVPA